jgi:hypothetical protein
VALGGQHSLWVAKEARKKSLEKGVQPPPWQCRCTADVLKSCVAIHIREAEAGADQYRQQSVETLPLSSTLAFFLKETERNPDRSDKQNMASAVAKTGKPRQDTLVCVGCACCCCCI